MQNLCCGGKYARPSGVANAAAPVGLFRIDKECFIQRANRFEHVTGYQHEHARNHINRSFGLSVPVSIFGMAQKPVLRRQWRPLVRL